MALEMKKATPSYTEIPYKKERRRDRKALFEQSGNSAMPKQPTQMECMPAVAAKSVATRLGSQGTRAVSSSAKAASAPQSGHRDSTARAPRNGRRVAATATPTAKRHAQPRFGHVAHEEGAPTAGSPTEQHGLGGASCVRRPSRLLQDHPQEICGEVQKFRVRTPSRLLQDHEVQKFCEDLAQLSNGHSDVRKLLQRSARHVKANRQCVLAAVKKHGNALEHAADLVKSDKEVVLAAVQQNGRALQYATDRLWSDREVVLAAVQQNGNAWKYASDGLQRDPVVSMVALQTYGSAKKYLDPAMKSNKDLMLPAVKLNGEKLSADNFLVQKLLRRPSCCTNLFPGHRHSTCQCNE